MMAAISAAKNENEVILLEKNNMLGKKLLITGKGRCNITSSLEMDEFIKNIPGNGRFLYSSFGNFTNIDIINMLKENGVEVKEERGNRIFPITDKSIDVRDAFVKELQKNKVKIKTGIEVKNILQKEGKVIGVKLANGDIHEADKIILATGGKSYPATGSTGDGYNMAKALGHTVTEIKPSLVPLTAVNDENIEIKIVEQSQYKTSLNLCKNLQGLSLRNVGIELIDENKNKKIYEDFGEMLFTHFGVSGPTILSSSSHLLRYKNVEELFRSGKVILKIDLKPALSEEKLNARILRDFEANRNKEIKNSLNELLPQKLIMPVINLLKIDEDKKVNSITKEERIELVKLLKNFQIAISGFRGIEEAIITAGGINVKEIDPKTMQSKLIQGLYFAGEIIDIDAYTGGFNLQIAYSTGFSAGINKI